MARRLSSLFGVSPRASFQFTLSLTNLTFKCKGAWRKTLDVLRQTTLFVSAALPFIVTQARSLPFTVADEVSLHSDYFVVTIQ